MMEGLRLIKTFASEEQYRKWHETSNESKEECKDELLSYHAFCGERVNLGDGAVKKGVAYEKQVCRSHMQRFYDCDEVDKAYKSALSELLAWRKTKSESAKKRSGELEDKMAKYMNLCTRGRSGEQQ